MIHRIGTPVGADRFREPDDVPDYNDVVERFYRQYRTEVDNLMDDLKNLSILARRSDVDDVFTGMVSRIKEELRIT